MNSGNSEKPLHGATIRLVESDASRRQAIEHLLTELGARLDDCFESSESSNTSNRISQSGGKQDAAYLRNLLARLTGAEYRQRRELAAILHDQLQQSFCAADLYVRLARKYLDEGPALEALKNANQLLQEAGVLSRNLSHRLRPPALYEAGLVKSIEWLSGEMGREKNLKVLVDANGAGRNIADELKPMLYDCVRELLCNVLRHSGVCEASVDVHEDETQFTICISDKGRGFDASSNASHEGGLYSIAQQLAAVGGAMTVNSKPGSGTRIELMVPASPSVKVAVEPRRESYAAPAHESQSGTNGNHRTRVLVVDDHAIVREGIAGIVNDDPRLTVVAEAVDGQGAVEAVERHRPEVVLMDVNMPRMNGIEATREIHSRWPDVAIIGLSVADDDATARSMLRAGAGAFLPKAGDSDELIATIVNLRSARA